MRFAAICHSVVLSLVITVATTAQAQNTPPTDAKSIAILWTAGAPGAYGTTSADIPKLYCYPAPGPGPHAAVVVLPGGGYVQLVMGKEGTAEAHWLNDHGVSAYVLQYRLSPAYMYPWPMVDGQRAVRFVRAHAREWDIKPDAIGVWGFSAGGHLAGYLATADPHSDARFHPELTPEAQALQNQAYTLDSIDKLSAHPDFAISSYGRLALSPEIPGSFGMKTLIGDQPTPALLAAVNPIAHVSKDTSPTFLYATENDEKVNAANATLFFNALQRAGVPAELHVFEQGPHGTGMGQNLPKSPELAIMPTLLEHWLQLHGWMP